MNKLYKNWSLLTISNVIYQGLFFLSFVRIARLFRPELYGVFTIIIASTQMAQILSSLGLQQIVIREIARDHSRLFDVAKLTLLPTAAASLASSGLLVLYLVVFEHIADNLVLLSSFLLLMGIMAWNYAEPLAFGQQRMKISASINIVSSVVFIVALFIIPSGSFNIHIILPIYVAVFLLRALVYLLVEWKGGYFKRASKEIHRNITLKYLLSKSLAFYGTTLLAIPIVQLPILFLSQLSGEREVGYFGIISRLSLPLSLIANNLFTAMYPVLAKFFVDDKPAFRQKAEKLFYLISIAGIILTSFLGFFSVEIVSLVLGPLYVNAARTFSLQVWATLLMIQNTFIGTIFLATDKERLMVKLSFLNSVIIGTASYIGAHYGAFGLSLSLWIGLILGLIPHWYFVSKAVGLKFEARLVTLLSFYFLMLSGLSVVIFEVNLFVRILIYISLSALVFFTLKNYIISDIMNLMQALRYYFKRRLPVS
ncbi:MAG TPA: oligosaccharide flippase family protein [Ignavibacteriales bacterium]|nr:oligosaccharide flippase family protein [Ignavibacteriales bacterium]